MAVIVTSKHANQVNMKAGIGVGVEPRHNHRIKIAVGTSTFFFTNQSHGCACMCFFAKFGWKKHIRSKTKNQTQIT